MFEENKPFKYVWQKEKDTGFLFIRTIGLIRGNDAHEYIANYMRDVPRGEAGFMLCDNREATGNSGEARRIFAKEWDAGEVYMAVFGTPSYYLPIVNLFHAGLKVLRPGTTGRSFTGEAEARAWLAEQRNAYLERRGKTAKIGSSSPSA